VLAFDGADFCLAASQETKQADPAGSHKKYGGAAAEAEEKIPHSRPLIWNRGGACRERAESAEESSADRRAVADSFFSGLHSDAELFYALWNQYKPYLF